MQVLERLQAGIEARDHAVPRGGGNGLGEGEERGWKAGEANAFACELHMQALER